MPLRSTRYSVALFVSLLLAALADNARAADDNKPKAPVPPPRVQGPPSVTPPQVRFPRAHRRQFDVGPEGFKNATQVTSAWKEAITPAGDATVRVLCGDKQVGYGTVVESEGWIVTKASLLSGDVVCQFADRQKFDARVAGSDERSDLALLKIDAHKLKSVAWRSGELPTIGTIVAASAPGDKLLAMGVVSDIPLKIPGPTKTEAPRGYLGIRLGGDGGDTEIQTVTPDSAAAQAGLLAGDKVQAIDGVDMKTTQQIVELIGSLPPGKKIKIAVKRGDDDVAVYAVLGNQQANSAGEAVKLSQDNWGGGPFSERRRGFPLVISDDLTIAPNECGGPLVDTDGKAVGVNIARALRVTSYALPAKLVQETVTKLKQQDDAAHGAPAVPAGQKAPAASKK